jgi:hypothetical protein
MVFGHSQKNGKPMPEVISPSFFLSKLATWASQVRLILWFWTLRDICLFSVVWVACCVHGVTKWGKQSDKIGWKSFQHQWKSGLGASLDHFGSRVAARTPKPGKTHSKSRQFARTWPPKGAFLEIPKIGNGTKIDQWRQDRHWDPLKTLSGSGFVKTRKINEILIGKWEVLDGLKPLKVWNCHRFHDF